MHAYVVGPGGRGEQRGQRMRRTGQRRVHAAGHHRPAHLIRPQRRLATLAGAAVAETACMGAQHGPRSDLPSHPMRAGTRTRASEDGSSHSTNLHLDMFMMRPMRVRFAGTAFRSDTERVFQVLGPRSLRSGLQCRVGLKNGNDFTEITPVAVEQGPIFSSRAAPKNHSVNTPEHRLLLACMCMQLPRLPAAAARKSRRARDAIHSGDAIMPCC